MKATVARLSLGFELQASRRPMQGTVGAQSAGDGTRASAPSVGTPGMPATPDESEGVPSKGLRRSAVAFAAAATAFLAARLQIV